jgi:hypothetical protein
MGDTGGIRIIISFYLYCFLFLTVKVSLQVLNYGIALSNILAYLVIFFYGNKIFNKVN